MGKIVKMKNKRTGEKVYPVTATSAVVDADSGERLNDALKNKVEEAPMDGNQYARINGAWKKVEGGSGSGDGDGTAQHETVLISLYPINGDINGATVKVVTSDNKTVLDTVWAGSQLVCEVEDGKKYTVSVGNVNNYNTPEPVTHTAIGGVSRTVNFTYEKSNGSLTVNVSGVNSGFTITVKDDGGQTLGSSTSASKSFNIPSGTTYYVYASAVSGYSVTEKLGPYVANAGSPNVVNVVYTKDSSGGGTTKPTNGVYILDTAGKFWDVDGWDGSAEADCVAIISDAATFGIALNDADERMAIHSTAEVDWETSLTAISDVDSALKDFDGKGNTSKMYKLNESPEYAIGWTDDFMTPGVNLGYLPSVGEMYIADTNREAVNEALEKAGGEPLSGNYWTSTFYGQNSGGYRCCWRFFWNTWGHEDPEEDRINKTNSVRAFVDIDLILDEPDV